MIRQFTIRAIAITARESHGNLATLRGAQSISVVAAGPRVLLDAAPIGRDSPEWFCGLLEYLSRLRQRPDFVEWPEMPRFDT